MWNSTRGETHQYVSVVSKYNKLDITRGYAAMIVYWVLENQNLRNAETKETWSKSDFKRSDSTVILKRKEFSRYGTVK